VPVSSDWPHASDSKAAGKMLCAHREKSLILNQGKITIRHKTRGKIAWAFMSFVQSLTPLGVDDGAVANWCFVNGTVGVNSQSKKNRGKITILIQNKGTNARAPIRKDLFF